MDLYFIPSPSRGVINLGPVPIRGYALCIIAGVAFAIWLGERRFVARGGRRGVIGDVAVWAVPFGLVGGRLYHVITTPGPYFGEGGDPLSALYIWKGGLGIWGAIALGAVGTWIAARRAGVPFLAVCDALAPGVVVAQAIGRWGNWFNQELFGKPTDLPWALEIDPQFRPDGLESFATFHPTFLYESLWCLGVAALVVWADRRFHLGYGRVFALYAAAYSVGRAWIEWLRVDDAHRFLDVRLNDWTSLLVIIAAVAYIVVSHRRDPGRESPEEVRGAAGPHHAHSGSERQGA
jgi:prolipoprotein diacylglyceryl transferase